MGPGGCNDAHAADAFLHDDGEDEASVDVGDVADGEDCGFQVGDFLVGVVGYAPLFAADLHVRRVVVEAR